MTSPTSTCTTTTLTSFYKLFEWAGLMFSHIHPSCWLCRDYTPPHSNLTSYTFYSSCWPSVRSPKLLKRPHHLVSLYLCQSIEYLIGCINPRNWVDSTFVKYFIGFTRNMICLHLLLVTSPRRPNLKLLSDYTTFHNLFQSDGRQ